MEESLNINIIGSIKNALHLPDTDLKTYSPLTLAFIGDVVFDLIIRTYVVEQGNAPVNKLHKRVSSLVKAPAQMDMFHKIEVMLTEYEMAVFKRGRNAKSFTSAKNASITEYRIATGFECLIGYLYLNNQFDRVMEIIVHGLMSENETNKETNNEISKESNSEISKETNNEISKEINKEKSDETNMK